MDLAPQGPGPLGVSGANLSSWKPGLIQVSGQVFIAESAEKVRRTLRRPGTEAFFGLTTRRINGWFHATTRRRDENRCPCFRSLSVAASREAGLGSVFNAESAEKDRRTLRRAEAPDLFFLLPSPSPDGTILTSAEPDNFQCSGANFRPAPLFDRINPEKLPPVPPRIAPGSPKSASPSNFYSLGINWHKKSIFKQRQRGVRVRICPSPPVCKYLNRGFFCPTDFD
ncbi:hypothetical protein DSOUD_2280 [Desulfuromonas soudanensis]|uniref:Uncharacterized protein n=1 Tax=Desulfuromonas soudanensis TaxID=1603606 RepID=A0A0M3QG21_9BACT|nr:hypothetical protein DSOUD_2280 [Desulfuromonas soudanensis]